MMVGCVVKVISGHAARAAMEGNGVGCLSNTHKQRKPMELQRWRTPWIRSGSTTPAGGGAPVDTPWS